MAPDQRSPIFFGQSRQSNSLGNLMLFLNLLGIIIIILLLLFWWPWYWGGRGVRVSGDGGGSSYAPAPGGSVIINTACCPETTGRECPDGKKTCEEECKEMTGGSRTAYESCLKSRCGKGEKTCEDLCNDKYGKGTTAAQGCIKDNCDGDDCQKDCEKRYPADSVKMLDCIQRECNPPGDGCEDDCRERYATIGTQYVQECIQRECDSCEGRCSQRYGAGTTAAQACIQSECNPPPSSCEDDCRSRYSSPELQNYQQQCIRDCNPPDCKDSDGYNLATAGKVVYGDETHSDSCYSASTVTEWTCDDGKPKESREPCQGRCEYGRCVPTSTSGGTTQPDPCRDYCEMAYSNSPTMIEQCVQQHWCPV